jgi:hypothetical protein
MDPYIDCDAQDVCKISDTSKSTFAKAAGLITAWDLDTDETKSNFTDKDYALAHKWAMMRLCLELNFKWSVKQNESEKTCTHECQGLSTEECTDRIGCVVNEKKCCKEMANGDSICEDELLSNCEDNSQILNYHCSFSKSQCTVKSISSCTGYLESAVPLIGCDRGENIERAQCLPEDIDYLGEQRDSWTNNTTPDQADYSHSCSCDNTSGECKEISAAEAPSKGCAKCLKEVPADLFGSDHFFQQFGSGLPKSKFAGISYWVHNKTNIYNRFGYDRHFAKAVTVPNVKSASTCEAMLGGLWNDVSLMCMSKPDFVMQHECLFENIGKAGCKDLEQEDCTAPCKWDNDACVRDTSNTMSSDALTEKQQATAMAQCEEMSCKVFGGKWSNDSGCIPAEDDVCNKATTQTDCISPCNWTGGDQRKCRWWSNAAGCRVVMPLISSDVMKKAACMTGSGVNCKNSNTQKACATKPSCVWNEDDEQCEHRGLKPCSPGSKDCYCSEMNAIVNDPDNAWNNFNTCTNQGNVGTYQSGMFNTRKISYKEYWGTQDQDPDPTKDLRNTGICVDMDASNTTKMRQFCELPNSRITVDDDNKTIISMGANWYDVPPFKYNTTNINPHKTFSMVAMDAQPDGSPKALWIPDETGILPVYPGWVCSATPAYCNYKEMEYNPSPITYADDTEGKSKEHPASRNKPPGCYVSESEAFFESMFGTTLTSDFAKDVIQNSRNAYYNCYARNHSAFLSGFCGFWGGFVGLGLFVVDIFEDAFRSVGNLFKSIGHFFSDRRLKTSLFRVKNNYFHEGIHLYTFQWNAIAEKELNLKGQCFGLLADELEMLFPELVNHDAKYKRVDLYACRDVHTSTADPGTRDMMGRIAFWMQHGPRLGKYATTAFDKILQKSLSKNKQNDLV